MEQIKYSIIWSPTAYNSFSKLEDNIKIRVSKKLEGMVVDPFSFSKRLVGSPLYSLRIGDYRILMMIGIKTKIIAIERAGLRKNVYDKL